MNELLRANVRAHGRRYVATGVAVAISTAFVLVCLMFTQGLANTLTSSIRDSYTGVAVVVDHAPDASESPDLAALATRLQGAPGVDTVSAQSTGWTDLRSGSTRLQRTVREVQPQPFEQPDLVAGALPDSASGILLDQSAADQFGVSVGGTVEALVTSSSAEGQSGADDAGSTGGTVTTTSVPFTVTGIVTTPRFGSPTLGVTADGLHAIFPIPYVDRILVAGTSPTPDATAQQQLADTVTQTLGSDQGVRVRTAAAALDQDLSDANLGQGTMTAMLLTFPLIALLVASIVVSSTFQVVLQQRRRELALLRTIGATARQVRRLLLVETLVVGALSSALGVVAALLLGSWGLTATDMAPSFTAGLASARPLTVLGVWALGTVLTVVLGIRPALSAARVPPMVALQPEDEGGAVARRSGRLRGVAGALLALAGGALIWVGLGMGEDPSGFVVVLGACLICLVGLLMVCSLLLPSFTHLLGGVGRGPVARMARENTLRNRRRTAATGTAIVIGVTLITTLLVGSTSLQASVFGRLDALAPLDLVATTPTGSMDASLAYRIGTVDGVQSTAREHMATATLKVGGSQEEDMVSLMGEPDLSAIARKTLAQPTADQVFLNESWVGDGSAVTVCVGTGSEDGTSDTTDAGTCRSLTPVASQRVAPGQAVVTSDVLSEMDPKAPISSVYARMTDGADLDTVQSAILSLDTTLDLSGAAPLRAQFTQMINAMLLVLLALLGVSVLVSLVGVTNTLALSVAERTRENGLLRALGLTRRQMKRMLLREALLISGSGAIVGLVLGLGFGMVGTKAVTAVSGIPAVFALPWWQLVVVLAIMVLAAVVASWWPGRRAARTSPVEALASE